MAIKASETGNKDLIESLTGEGGPLQAGLLPAAPVKNEKALHDAFGDATKAVKTPKPKKGDSTEKAEPKTFEQRRPQEFTRKKVYLQFSVVVVQTKSPYLTQKHLFPQHDQNLVAKKTNRWQVCKYVFSMVCWPPSSTLVLTQCLVDSLHLPRIVTEKMEACLKKGGEGRRHAISLEAVEYSGDLAKKLMAFSAKMEKVYKKLQELCSQKSKDPKEYQKLIDIIDEKLAWFEKAEAHGDTWWHCISYFGVQVKRERNG